MIHIIVLILKIIGIILLILLGLLLLTVITVLLVPIRYQGHGSYYGTLEGEGQVSWLFHSVRAVITLSDSGPDIRVFLLWKQLGSGEKDDLEDMLEEDWADLEKEPEVHTASLEPENQSFKARENIPEPSQIPRQPKPKKKKRRFPFQGFCDKLKKAKGKKDQIVSWIRKEENRATVLLLICQAKKLAAHLFPRKISGKILFGTEDPYRTGQILAGLALLLPLYRDHLQICPVFDRSILEGELSLKGRIRLGTVAAILLRIWLDRNFRMWFRRLMKR